MKPARAIITAQRGGDGSKQGARSSSLEKIEGYSVDSAMDTDADAFTIDIGDPTLELTDFLKRDTELKVNIFGGEEANQILKLGFADMAQFTEQNVLTIQGRDASSLATDSQAPPGEWKNCRPHERIKKEAAELGFPKTRLATTDPINKVYRDGSESFWEFWYRLARKRDMWLWCEPDGTLVMDELNYGHAAKYFFGRPTANLNGGTTGQWIGVTSVQILKNTQTRVGEIYYFGETGAKHFYVHAIDPSIRTWQRRPIKVMFDSDVKTKKEAKKAAWEEIFEGKVGSVEIVLTIDDPGFEIQQNNMAMVNLPEVGIQDQFYVVGVKINGGPDGFVQEVRLREKNFALSRRVPDDPELIKDENQSVIAGTVGNFPISRPEWSQFFWRAAQKWHPSGIAIDLYAAVLIGIAIHETGIRNIRSTYGISAGGGSVHAPESRQYKEWYPESAAANEKGVEEWKNTFANHRENPRTGGAEFAVGPMQLYTRSFKTKADQVGGKSGEYDGGRWEPEANIMTGGEALAGKMQGLPHTDAGLKKALEGYFGFGLAGAQEFVDFVWDKAQKLLPDIQSAAEAAATPGELENVPARAPAEVKKAIDYALRQLGKPYEWAADGPDTFDCSGLFKAAYRYATNGRIDPPHFTGSISAAYPHVTRSGLLPGDGVMFKPDLGHMGIYLGDGQFIEAPFTGANVRISAMNSRDDFRWGVRPVAWKLGAPGLD